MKYLTCLLWAGLTMAPAVLQGQRVATVPEFPPPPNELDVLWSKIAPMDTSAGFVGRVTDLIKQAQRKPMLVYIDTAQASDTALAALDPATVTRFAVFPLTTELLQEYGPPALFKSGMIWFGTKAGYVGYIASLIATAEAKHMLILLDDSTVDAKVAAALDLMEISKATVFPGDAAATDRYGLDAKNGILSLTRRTAKSLPKSFRRGG